MRWQPEGERAIRIHGAGGAVPVGEAETTRSMVSTLNETGVLIDPHTAVGVAGLSRAGRIDAPVVAITTFFPRVLCQARVIMEVLLGDGMCAPCYSAGIRTRGVNHAVALRTRACGSCLASEDASSAIV